MHICFSITAHGFGHGAISCSVINQFINKIPDCRITVLSKLPSSYLQDRIVREFTHISEGHDFGMMMHSPIEVDVSASHDKYMHLLEDWDSCVEREKQCLAEIKPDLLISNISPISLTAAMQLGIKTASVAPFNWAQIYQAYSLDEQNPSTQKLHQKMCDVYQRVDFVFKPLPSVPDNNNDEINIASIASHPVKPAAELISANQLDDKKQILFALGGIPMPIELPQLPELEGWHWLVDQKTPENRTDMRHIADLSLSFLQLLASSDVIITKPGYGSYCEIAALAKHKQVRVLSLVRPDWPETPYLNAFLRARVPFMEIELADLEGDKLTELIDELLQLPYPEAMSCDDGSEQLMAYLQKELSILTES
ncbi:hypothetical protein P7F88_08115 [Vibrio hannami]|uniref:hypothetical protein n=1 Tax=Vibrio hannami TaxID=2717094 RepID=UPI00240F245B|nr:hypothetical protein [Vibrio hannami]MDG3086062.1 hypothetical protein [Vibrio hannami]